MVFPIAVDYRQNVFVEGFTQRGLDPCQTQVHTACYRSLDNLSPLWVNSEGWRQTGRKEGLGGQCHPWDPREGDQEV